MKVQLIQIAILPDIEFEAWLQLVYGGNVNNIICKRHLCLAAKVVVIEATKKIKPAQLFFWFGCKI